MMGKVRLSVFLSILLSSLGFLTSCETDVYEKGTGKYSLMLTDLAEVTVDDQKTATAFTTDDGDSYIFSPAITAKWIQTADTIYRAIVYYNQNTDGIVDTNSGESVYEWKNPYKDVKASIPISSS